MKLTSLLVATTALLLLSACNQDSQEVADANGQMAAEAKEVIETTKVEAETFATTALIDPNSADANVITSIPGVDAELAQRVIAGRPYATPSALHAVLKDAVNESELKTIYDVMFVKVDLNTGSNADYQLIPTTMSPKRLAHEFEEYRPYTSIEQFGREMSKYVSAEEVAFLKRYVVIE